jgi:hypothetical protein
MRPSTHPQGTFSNWERCPATGRRPRADREGTPRQTCRSRAVSFRADDSLGLAPSTGMGADYGAGGRSAIPATSHAPKPWTHSTPVLLPGSCVSLGRRRAVKVERPAGRTTLTALVRRRHWATEEDGGTADERSTVAACGRRNGEHSDAARWRARVLCRTSIVEQVARAAGADGRPKAGGRRKAPAEAARSAALDPVEADSAARPGTHRPWAKDGEGSRERALPVDALYH